MAIAREIKRNQDPEGMLRRALERIIQLYTDKSHFVYELLQNAEDAGASKIRFVQHADELEVLHDGSSFSVENLQSLCDIGKSDKISNLNQIGEFGVGFKSVFGICEEVLLYSSPTREERETGRRKFAVKIENFTNPTDIAFEKFEKEYTTKFVFPYAVGLAFSGFDSIDKLNKAVSRRLQNLGITTLLFMKNLQSISYEIDLPDLKKSGSYSLEKTRINNHCFLVCASGETARKSEEISYLIFSRKVSGMKTGRTIDLAFSVSVDEDGKYTFVKTKNPYISVYFPTEKESKLHFIVQGPFRTTPNRGSVPDDDKDNIELASQMARLLRDSVLELRDMGRLNLSLLNILPISKNDFENAPLFKGMYETVAEMMQKEAVLCCRDGSYATADSVKIARGEKFADVLSDALLTELIHDGKRYHWLPTSLTETSKKYGNLYYFLTEVLKIDVMRPENLKDFINGNPTFMARRHEAWLVRFYNMYTGISGAFTKQKAGSNMMTAQMIRTSKGEFVAPYRRIEADSESENWSYYGGHEAGSYVQNVYLPSDASKEMTELNFVDEKLVASCKEFFIDTLHLEQPDEYEFFVHDFTARKGIPGRTGFSSKQHLKDVKHLLMYMDNRERAKEISELMRQFLHLLCVKNGKRVWVNPYHEKVYFTVTQDERPMSIEQYFKNIAVCSYVNLEFYEEADISYADLLLLGVRNSVALGAEETCGECKGKSGYKTTWKTYGYFRWKLVPEHLDDVLEYIDKYPKASDSMAKSGFIFAFLMQNENRLTGTVYFSSAEGEKDSVHSSVVTALCRRGHHFNDGIEWSGKWLYTESFELVSQAEISKRELNTNLYGELVPDSRVYDILGFKKSLDDRLEETARTYDQIPQEDKERYFELELMRRYGISVKELDDSVNGHAPKRKKNDKSVSEFPVSNIKSWDALKKHAAEMLCFASPVKYEHRVRSIRTSRPQEEIKAYLKNTYRTNIGYACQMCHKTFSYINACEIEKKPEEELDPMNLCLCPNCATEYRRLRENSAAVRKFINDICGMSDAEINSNDTVKIEFGGESIWFTQTHIAEIRELILLKEQTKSQIKEQKPKDEYRFTNVAATSGEKTEKAEEVKMVSGTDVYREYIGKRVYHHGKKKYAVVKECDGKYIVLRFEDEPDKDVKFSLEMCRKNDWLQVLEYDGEVVEEHPKSKKSLRQTTQKDDRGPMQRMTPEEIKRKTKVDLTAFLQQRDLQVIDKRGNGGNLWVIGGQELAPILEETKERYGAYWTFAKSGGWSTGNRPAWFTKSDK